MISLLRRSILVDSTKSAQSLLERWIIISSSRLHFLEKLVNLYEQEYWSKFQIPIEKQDFIPDSADEPFTKWYFGTVRSKPAWQSEENEEHDQDELILIGKEIRIVG